MTAAAREPFDPTVISPALRRLVLPLLSFCTFSVIFNNLILGPVLRDIANDLDVSVGAAGLLLTAYAAAAALVAFFAAPLLDRFGRRRVILFSITTLAIGTFASAAAPNFWLLLACRALAGIGVAGLQPAVMAAVGDYFPYSERGRAMGWVVAANTVAGIVGVPVGAVLADVFSWRITFVMLGTITAAVGVVFATRFPRIEPAAAVQLRSDYRADYLSVLRNRFAVVLIVSNAMVSFAVFSWFTYMGPFLIDEFGLSTGELGPVLAAGSFGVLVGSFGGGRIADKIGKRPVIIAAGFGQALFTALVANVILGVGMAILLYFLWAVPGGARISGSMALTTEMLPEKRGTLMAINASGQQIGIMSGAAAGGLAVAIGGYGLAGLMSAAVGIASTLLVLWFVDERAATASRPASAEA